MRGRLSNVIGFDDAPCEPRQRGGVLVVGAVFAGLSLQGVISGRIRYDGADATCTLARLVSTSKFAGQTQLVLIQGIAFAGFNVVDIHGLHHALDIPVMAVARRQANMQAVYDALHSRVPGGARKWAIIERAGPMEPVAGLFVQRAGISLGDAKKLIERFAIHGHIPEPLRTAHLIAGGIASGQSRGRT